MKEIRTLAALHGITSLEVELLLAHVLGISRTALQTWPEKLLSELSEEQKETLYTLILRRSAGEPLAYLTGTKEFWSLPLIVSKDVLIPRPETECLVELVLCKVNLHHKKIRVLDLGTGSGAIALALAVERPEWQIVGVDRSIEALEIARLNAKNLTISNVEWIQSDWFSHFVLGENVFDLIVGNPPYIDPNDNHLQGDIRFEPKAALVSLPDGLQDLQKIIHKAPDYLVSKGWLFLEHGFDQGTFVKKAMELAGFTNIQTHPDLAKLDRITLGQMP